MRKEITGALAGTAAAKGAAGGSSCMPSSRSPIAVALFVSIVSVACDNASEGEGSPGGVERDAGTISHDGQVADGPTGASEEAGALPDAKADASSTPGGDPLPIPSCVATADLPAWRKSIPKGSWKQLSTADLAVVTPAVQPGGYYAARIDAWNGFAADTINNQLYIGGAGGHHDYAGNEVYRLDLNAAAPQWVLQDEPSPPSAYRADQAYYADGRPTSSHTYYGLWFIEGRQKLFRFSAGAIWGNGGALDRIDSWNPSTKNWDPEGTNPSYGGSPTSEMPTAKDPLSGDVYQLQANNHLYRWNQVSNTITDLGDATGGSGSFYELSRSPSVVDTAGKRLLFLSDTSAPTGTIRVYDIEAKKWSKVPLAGTVASSVANRESQAMAYYDYCAKLVFVKPSGGGVVYTLDPTTMTTAVLTTTGPAVPDAINGVHTLFQSLPKLGGYAYQPRHDAKLYFLATQ